MSDELGSALVRRHIGRRFLALRERAGLSQDQAAALLQRSRTTVGRVEEGNESVRFRDVEVKNMLETYGATPEETTLLLALTAETRNGRRKGWWHDYTQTALPQWFSQFVLLEDSAELIREYQPELIPGLLQTVAYAEQVTRVPANYIDQDEIERRVKVREERQSLLTRPRAPHLRVIINEAVLHRVVGGRELMRQQLEHLVTIGTQANVSVRIVPYAAGAHGGMAAGAGFLLLDFPRDPLSSDLLEPPLAYVDTLTGALYLNKPDEVRAYRLAWDDIEERALTETESRAALITALERWKEKQ